MTLLKILNFTLLRRLAAQIWHYHGQKVRGGLKMYVPPAGDMQHLPLPRSSCLVKLDRREFWFPSSTICCAGGDTTSGPGLNRHSLLLGLWQVGQNNVGSLIQTDDIEEERSKHHVAWFGTLLSSH